MRSNKRLKNGTIGRAITQSVAAGLELQRGFQLCQRRTVSTGHFACVTILYNADL